MNLTIDVLPVIYCHIRAISRDGPVFLLMWPRLLKCFSLHHIYVLNGLLLHIEGCMKISVYKLEIEPCISPSSRDCLFVFITMLNKVTHLDTSVPSPFVHATCMCMCERFFLRHGVHMLLFAFKEPSSNPVLQMH